MNVWSLEGKKALVTGGSKGIGQACVYEMASLGAEVIFSARDLAGMEAALEEAGPLRSRIHGVIADNTEPGDREKLVAAIRQRWGRLDILVNNVGTNIRKPFEAYDAEEIDLIFRTNLNGAVSLTRALFEFLKDSAPASVINVSSVAGSVDVRSGAPYGMTKAALNQLTRHLAVEWGPWNIRVNSVSPWYTDTPLASPVLNDPERLKGILERTPLGRIAAASEVARVICFLGMEASSYVTGQNIAVDGGMLSRGL